MKKSTMNITPIKTPIIVVGDKDLLEIIDDALPVVNEGSVIAVTSKIVSICERSVVSKDAISKDKLIACQADLYLPLAQSVYRHHFTVTHNTLIPAAGIDESNGGSYYILWPKNAQTSANQIRRHLSKKHGIKNVGVVITDSTCQPFRRGVQGIYLAHSGFMALRSYIGKADIFGRSLVFTQSNIACGLAAAAVLAMGEGDEQTPLCLITDPPDITFQSRNPSKDELDELTISLEDDLFAPFLTSVEWKQGNGGCHPD